MTANAALYILAPLLFLVFLLRCLSPASVRVSLQCQRCLQTRDLLLWLCHLLRPRGQCQTADLKEEIKVSILLLFCLPNPPKLTFIGLSLTLFLVFIIFDSEVVDDETGEGGGGRTDVRGGEVSQHGRELEQFQRVATVGFKQRHDGSTHQQLWRVLGSLKHL